jgi:hypothetical protein
MGVYKQRKSKNWWYKFTWNGALIRKSTKQTNKRVAEQMEAAHKTALAKGEAGIREKPRVGTLADFADHDFLPFVRSTSKDKPNTVRFYENSVANLKAYAKLAKLQLDEITSDVVGSFIAHRQAKRQERRKDKPLETSTINRDLATLRRMLCLAQEWGKVEKLLPKIKLLPGENQRERVLTAQEDTAYLKAANELGVSIEQKYDKALKGVRATVRGKQPIKPDAFQLRDVVTDPSGLWPSPGGVLQAKARQHSGRSDLDFSGEEEGITSSDSHDGSSAGIPRSAAFTARRQRMGLPSPYKERSHRGIDSTKTACEGSEGKWRDAIRTLRITSHVLNTLGKVDGPVHIPQSCWTY